MAKRILKWSNVRGFFWGSATTAYDLAGDLNSFSLSPEVSVVDTPDYGSDWMSRLPGLQMIDASFEGYTSDGNPGFAELGGAGAWIVGRQLAALGEPMIFGTCQTASLSHSAAVGEALIYSLNLPSDGSACYGKMLRNAWQDSAGTSTPDTGPATGAEVQIGTVTAPGQKLMVAVALLALTGTSVTFSFETDVTGFASPVERVNSGALTAPAVFTGEFTSSITPDDFIRVVTTGTFTSATFVAVAGVATT